MLVIQAVILILAIFLAVYVGRHALSGQGRLDYTRLLEGVGILLAGIAIVSSFGEVPAGFRGVVLRFGATTGEVKQPGFYTVTPFITTVAVMNVQIQAYSAEAAAASHDLQNVQTKVTLNYSVDPDKVVDIYNRLNQDYQDRVIAPAIQEATKAATAQFSAEELITRRPEARNLLEKNLDTRLNQFDMHIAAMSITDFQFSADFTTAIEAKVVAFQNYLQSQNRLKQSRVEAQQAIAQAQGAAEANRLRRLQITPLTVQYDAIQKWDGHLPTVTSGAIPLISLGALRPSTP
jgi:regulator of protease activity HflC (stomatin/prohibitin superfamily)